jgi:hypothetical protein
MAAIFPSLMYQCGMPYASQADIDAWNALEGGTSLSDNTEIKVGIFGYDITCLASRCIEGDTEDSVFGACDLVQARGLDGLAFGVRFDLDDTTGSPYCAGFHNEGRNDTATCANADGPQLSYEWRNNYTVVDSYWDGDNTQNRFPETIPSYGLGPKFFYGQVTLSNNDGFERFNSFRFIGANENDGNRYSVGDIVSMFLLDSPNEEMTDSDHELANAVALAAGSLAALAVTLM